MNEFIEKFLNGCSIKWIMLTWADPIGQHHFNINGSFDKVYHYTELSDNGRWIKKHLNVKTREDVITYLEKLNTSNLFKDHSDYKTD